MSPRTRRLAALLIPLSASLLLALGACGEEEASGGGGEVDEAAATEAAAKAAAQAAAAFAEAMAPKKEGPQVPVTPKSAAAEGSRASEGSAGKYAFWAPVHDFLGAAVVSGEVLGPKEAIAFTKDGHVGVTRDAGASWGFIRHETGTVLAVGGEAGGPYVAVGKAGYVASSVDGRQWTPLPRYTAEDLVDLVVRGGIVLAIGSKGAWLRIGADGRGGASGSLPDKFKAKGLVQDGDTLYAIAGKKGLLSKDGTTWTKAASLPEGVSRSSARTSRGTCTIGKVGKKKGVVCAVEGTAFGLGGQGLLVEKKGTASVSRDGGDTWAVGSLPFKGVEGVVGTASGPWWAFGAKGGLARSEDGTAWVEQPLNTSKTLRAGWMDGETLVIVGDGGSIARSTDGGASWSLPEPPVSKKLDRLAKVGGPLIAGWGKGAIASSDGGATWIEVDDSTIIEALSGPGKASKCEGTLPVPGRRCIYSRKRTSPLGLPNVKSIRFQDDVGLATGDAALVAFTTDGGATWKARSGLGLKRLSGFDVRGDRIVAVGKGAVIVSIDGGKTFKEAQLPKKTGDVADVLITDSGTVFAAGAKGTVLKSEGTLDLWQKVEVGPKVKASFTLVEEAAGALFVAGKKGELYRSADKGASWSAVPTGMKEGIQAVTSEGDVVLAVTRPGRRGGNILLRSNDAGAHFFVQRELSHQGRVLDFELAAGVLTYQDRVSSDFAATWTKRPGNPWWGAVDTEDGSGLSLVARSSYYGKDRLFLVGSGEDDWTLLDGVYAEDAWFRCDKGSGCWMVSGGRVYRPL